MTIHFVEEKIGAVAGDIPVYNHGAYVGLIHSPASSGRKTWRLIIRGNKVGDFQTAEDAKAAARTELGS